MLRKKGNSEMAVISIIPSCFSLMYDDGSLIQNYFLITGIDSGDEYYLYDVFYYKDALTEAYDTNFFLTFLY